MKTSDILCWLRIHKWTYITKKGNSDRCCKRCNRRERPVYDMSYGEIYYKVVKE